MAVNPDLLHTAGKDRQRKRERERETMELRERIVPFTQS